MTFQPNPPPPGQPRQLNLKQMAEQFMAGMQRHFDMLAFNLVSREAAAESAYDERAKAVGLMPVASLHRNFEQTQAQARDLLHAQVMNDAMNLAVHCLHNAHLFLAVIRANHDRPGQQAAIQEEVNKAQQAFVRAQMDEKFNQLENNYKVMCPLEDTILSMGFALQAFARQQGIVREGQIDDSGELTFELKHGREGIPLADLARPGTDVETVNKVFREGEKIAFSDSELQCLLLTVTAFGQELFQSVADYARDHRPPQP